MVAPAEASPLVIRRRYVAAPKVVFELWTCAELLAKWLRPSPDFTHQFIEAEPVVGGSYRIAFESPDGKVDVVAGEYLDVDPPARLVFSWKWEPPSEHAGIDSRVTVEFLDVDGETELILTHGLTDSGMKESHNMGWSGALDQIPNLLSELKSGEAG